ncbi:MAG: pimeloyl-ACP methyl ester carboxylesterase [Marivirga sp.]|jgi:pimeloyl-ACP methyl ester carboxylesterase
MAEAYLNYEKYFNSLEAEWIILLHGAGGSIATWKYQKQFLSKTYNLLLIDLRDHGKSNVENKQNYSFSLITNDIVKVIEQQGIEKAHFVTLSFGSVILQHLSMQYPQYIQSAIFAGGIFKPGRSIKLFVHAARALNLLLPYKWMYSLFSLLLMPKRHHQKSRYIYQQQAAKLSSEAYMKWVGLYKEFFHLLANFYQQELTFPALVVMGSEDYVFLQSAKYFVARRANVDLKVIEGAGHICNIDQPKNFNQMVYHFLLKQTSNPNLANRQCPDY